MDSDRIGLLKKVDHNAMENILAEEKNTKHNERSMIRKALEAGGRDNITVVIAHAIMP